MENQINNTVHENNLLHFTAMVYMAQLDGTLKKKEIALLTDFSKKMGIEPHEFNKIMKNPTRPPLKPSTSTSNRMKRIFSMFKIVFVNRKMHHKERLFIYRYALQIGFSKSNARKVIHKSTAMFTGKFDFDTYDSFVKN
jgi:uncharacterized tellurite resistance protein B-like protein